MVQTSFAEPEDCGQWRKPRRILVRMTRTPLSRLGIPDEVASVVAFLVSLEAAYITGEIIYIDEGRLVLNYRRDNGTNFILCRVFMKRAIHPSFEINRRGFDDVCVNLCCRE